MHAPRCAVQTLRCGMWAKGHLLYDLIYTKYPEKANPLREKVDQWLLGAEEMENEEQLLISMKFLFGVMKMF